jgi:hypothetical protein
MLQLVTINQEQPELGEFYLVRCPDYCDSGWQVAEWTESGWEHGHFSESCNDFVIGYVSKKLNEWRL